MDVQDVVRLIEEAEAAGVAGKLEAEFAVELNAIENNDEGLVAPERLAALAQAARTLLGKGRRFFVTEISFQVLSEDTPVSADLDLGEVYEETVSGDWSGMEIGRTVREIGAKEMAEALAAQGSDSEFFALDEDGNELER